MSLRFRRGTAAAAAANNPLLLSGEPGFETDTGKVKIGDGVTLWNALPYFAGELADLTIDEVTDASATGIALVRAVNAAAGRSALGLGTAAVEAAVDLKNRANHTGTQTSATISDFAEAAQDALAAALGAGSNVIVTYDDAANTITISATGGGSGGLTVEDVRDAIGVTLVGVGVVSVSYNDALDTITVSSTATVNATDAALRDRSTHTGTQSADTITDGSTNKAYTAAEKTKLAGISGTNTGDQDLSGLVPKTTTVNSKPLSGNITLTQDDVGDGTTNKAYTSTEKTKLAGIATGATANATDAQLRDRATHTGTQTAATISDLTESVQDIVGALLSGTTGVTVTYNDAANTLTVSGLGDSSATAETIRDTIGVALVGAGLITVTANDALDTITVTTTATANSTDAQLRDRSTHTGTQTASTISDLTESVQDIVGALIADGTGIDAVYNDAGNLLTINATGGGGGGAAGYRQFLGAVSANSTVTVTHSLNTLAVNVVMHRTWLQSGALGSASPGDQVPVKWRVADENSVVLEFVDPAAANEYAVIVEPINVTMDTTGTTPGTLSSTAQTTTTIDLSLSAGTDAETTPAGVEWYRVIGGVDTLVTTTASTGGTATTTISGLTANTSYQFKAKRFNLNGTKGAFSNTLTISTAANPSPPAFDATSMSAATGAGSGTLAPTPWNHTMGTGANGIIVEVPVTNNGSGTWVPSGTPTCTVGGVALTYKGVQLMGNAAIAGPVMVFAGIVPAGSNDARSIVVSASNSGLGYGNAFGVATSYSNVGSFGSLVSAQGTVAANAVSVPSATGRLVHVMFANYATSTYSSPTITLRRTNTAAAPYFINGDQAGAATVNAAATESNGAHWAGVALDILPAA